MPMETLYRIDINLFSAFVLLIVGTIAFRRLDRRDGLNRAFFFTSLIIVGELLIEAATCAINGIPGTGFYVLSTVLHILLFIGAPFLTTYWFMLLFRVIIPSKAHPRWLRFMILVPQIANFLIVILSPWSGWVFFIGTGNVYHRGSLFAVSSFITYFYLVLSVLMILRNRKKMSLWNMTLLLVASFLPLLGGLIQTLMYGILTMWPSVAMALIVLYLFLQERLVHLDGLTGVWNRESFDHYINERLRLFPDRPFAALYFDLDHLKIINDLFGHSEGDLALQESVNIIRTALGPDDIIARMGGDEFLVILNTSDAEKMDLVRRSILERLERYNRDSGKPYQIGLSAGGALYGPHYSSIEQFVHHIDQMMYEDKRLKTTSNETGQA